MPEPRAQSGVMPEAEEVQEYAAPSQPWLPPRAAVPRVPGPHKVALPGEPFVPERTPRISFGEPKTATNEMAFFNEHYPIPVSHRTPDLDNRYADQQDEDDGLGEHNSPGRRRTRTVTPQPRASLDSVRMSADDVEPAGPRPAPSPPPASAAPEGTAVPAAGPSRAPETSPSASLTDSSSSLVAATLRRQFKSLMDEVMSKSLPSLPPPPAPPSSSPAPAPPSGSPVPAPPSSSPLPGRPSGSPVPAPPARSPLPAARPSASPPAHAAPAAPTDSPAPPPTAAPADLRTGPSTPSRASGSSPPRSASSQRAAPKLPDAIERLEDELRVRVASEQAAAVARAEGEARAAQARARELETAMEEQKATSELHEVALREELTSLRGQLRRLKSGGPMGELMAHFDADVARLQGEIRRLTEENASLLAQLEKAQRHPPPPPSPQPQEGEAPPAECCPPERRSPSPGRQLRAGETASAGELAALWRQVADTCTCRHRPPSALYRALAAANKRVGELHAELNSLRKLERADSALRRAWGDTSRQARKAQKELETRAGAIVERDLALVQMQTIVREAAAREAKLRDESAEMATEIRRLKEALDQLEAEKSHAARYLGRSQRAMADVHTGAAQAIAGLFERLEGELHGNLNPKAKNTLRRLRGEVDALESHRAELARQQQRVVKEMMRWVSSTQGGGADDCRCDEKLGGAVGRSGRGAAGAVARGANPTLQAIQNILMPQA